MIELNEVVMIMMLKDEYEEDIDKHTEGVDGNVRKGSNVISSIQMK